jgi:hypothetical protein
MRDTDRRDWPRSKIFCLAMQFILHVALWLALYMLTAERLGVRIMCATCESSSRSKVSKLALRL